MSEDGEKRSTNGTFEEKTEQQAEETSAGQGRLGAVEAFQGIAPEIMRLLEARFTPVPVARGDFLLRQGAEALALYVIVSGRFEVLLGGRSAPVAELGAGDPVGEIAFFAGGLRSASVRAVRDSLVLRLTRADFETVAGEHPAVLRAILAFLARRLAETTGGARPQLHPRPRTVALVRAGAGRMPEGFPEALQAALAAHGRTLLVVPGDLPKGLTDVNGPAATAWLNDLETRFDTAVYLAGPEPDDWSKKALRQADLVVLVADAASALAHADMVPNPLERLAMASHAVSALRLLLLHPARRAPHGTSAWLRERSVHMHHHASLADHESLARLARFLTGRAVGLVASGGGAYCAAHIGMHAGLRQEGVRFDAFGGTSGGSAMAAAFALGVPGREIARRLEDTFVRRRALRRWTWPRYGLMDPEVLDDALRENFGEGDIADMWKPYFAVSASLTTGDLKLHRDGPLWQAIRASSAIPGLLPPFLTDEGEVLVDGAMIDNVPVRSMRDLKAGPNAVLAFRPPPMAAVEIGYGELPSRRRLALGVLSRGLARLPDAPGPRTVLMRALDLGRLDMRSGLGREDELFLAPIPPGLSVLDWRQGVELMEAGRFHVRSQVKRLRAAGSPLVSPR